MERYVKAIFIGKRYKSRPYYWVIDKNNKFIDKIKVNDHILVENVEPPEGHVKVLEIFESEEPPYDGEIKKVIRPVARKKDYQKKTEHYKTQWQDGKGFIPKKIIYKRNNNKKELNFNNVLNYINEYYFYKAMIKGVNIEIDTKDRNGVVIFIFE